MIPARMSRVRPLKGCVRSVVVGEEEEERERDSETERESEEGEREGKQHK